MRVSASIRARRVARLAAVGRGGDRLVEAQGGGQRRDLAVAAVQELGERDAHVDRARGFRIKFDKALA